MQHSLLLAWLLFSTVALCQDFEYVYSQHEMSRFYDAVHLGDKIFVAADLDQCPGSGYLIFDTLGKLVEEHVIASYFSVTPAMVLDTFRDLVHLITFTNESEELYDVTQVILTSLNSQAEIVQSMTDTVEYFPAVDDFSNTSLVVNSDYLIFSNGNNLHFYSATLDTSFVRLLPKPDDATYHIGMVDENELLIYTGDPQYKPGGSYFRFDSLWYYHITNDAMELSVIENSKEIHLVNKSLYAIGEDHILRKYNCRGSTPIDSLDLDADIVSIDIVALNNSIYHLFQFSHRMMWFREGESLGSLDTLFTHSHPLQAINLSEHGKQVLLVGSVTFKDSSYRYGPTFPVLQRLDPNNGLSTYEGNLAVESVEILDSLKPEECSGDLCEFDYLAGAVSEVVIRNVGEVTVDNFTYYNNSTGGSFCFTGRNSRYFEIALAPGEILSFKDTIGGVGTVRTVPYHAFIQVPDHRLEQDRSDNSMQAYLYVTSLVEIPNSTLQIYPNPVGGVLKIDLPGGNSPNLLVAKVGIYDLAGKKVQEVSLQPQGLHVDFLSPGFYHVRVRDQQKVYFGSFVKN